MPWQHLLARDGWNGPNGVDEDQAFLMVQFMETWFLADKDGLRGYFGQGFSDRAIRQWPDLEAVPRETVLRAQPTQTGQHNGVYNHAMIDHGLAGDDVRFTGNPAGVLGMARPRHPPPRSGQEPS